MNQLVSPLPLQFKSTEKILCYYVNVTDRLQVVKVTNSTDCCQERVVFPNQRFLFEAPPTAWLEIYRSTVTGASLCDRISCNYLRVKDSSMDAPRELVTASSAIAG